ncbi:hypothetical protein C8R45DRAFT_1091129 [Mycena sanguinolenta]|nr:hypothetical protein C8R45DRAFT_1091129 [Mycena sanguinolenta]
MPPDEKSNEVLFLVYGVFAKSKLDPSLNCPKSCWIEGTRPTASVQRHPRRGSAGDHQSLNRRRQGPVSLYSLSSCLLVVLAAQAGRKPACHCQSSQYLFDGEAQYGPLSGTAFFARPICLVPSSSEIPRFCVLIYIPALNSTLFAARSTTAASRSRTRGVCSDLMRSFLAISLPRSYSCLRLRVDYFDFSPHILALRLQTLEIFS